MSVPTTPIEQTTENKYKIFRAKHSYSENHPDVHILCETYDDLYNQLWDENDCVYEVLDKPMRKIYLDIEGIPFEEKHVTIVKKIINDFADFLDIDSRKVNITYNSGSTGHLGASYHVIFDYKANYQLLKKVVITFKQLHPEYSKYIDESVYSCFRLFRLPFQGKQRPDQEPDINDQHIPINTRTWKPDDIQYKTDIKLRKFIIQDIYNPKIQEVTVQILPAETVRQIGRMTLESDKTKPIEYGKSGQLKTKQFIESINVQMAEIKESNANLSKQVADLTKVNAKLFDALAQLLGSRNISMD